MNSFTTFCFFAISVCFVFGNSSTDFNTYVDLATALKYNDKCSWDNEAFRQRAYKPASAGGFSNVTELMDGIVQNKRKLCNILEQFTCGKETERCVCGDPSKKFAYPDYNISSDFEVVRDEDGIYRCQYKEGSYCITRDMSLSQKWTNSSYFQCVDGTSCKSNLFKGRVCSFDSLILYGVQNKTTITKESMAKALLNGTICSCQRDEAANDNFEKNNYGSKNRVKKSVEESFRDEDREWAKDLIASTLKYF